MSSGEDLMRMLRNVSAAAAVPPSASDGIPAEPPNPEEEAKYASITIDGLRRYRPDVIQALQMTSPEPRRRSPAAKEAATAMAPGALGSYQAYMADAKSKLASDPTAVSGRRLANLRMKYLAALAEAAVVLAGADVSFAINGAEIVAVWAGQKPTLPQALEI